MRGLHYNYFRTYNPGIGRYAESDPIGLQGGLSTYLYVGASPINAVDVFGLFAENRTFDGLLENRTYDGLPENGFDVMCTSTENEDLCFEALIKCQMSGRNPTLCQHSFDVCIAHEELDILFPGIAVPRIVR